MNYSLLLLIVLFGPFLRALINFGALTLGLGLPRITSGFVTIVLSFLVTSAQLSTFFKEDLIQTIVINSSLTPQDSITTINKYLDTQISAEDINWVKENIKLEQPLQTELTLTQKGIANALKQVRSGVKDAVYILVPFLLIDFLGMIVLLVIGSGSKAFWIFTLPIKLYVFSSIDGFGELLKGIFN